MFSLVKLRQTPRDLRRPHKTVVAEWLQLVVNNFDPHTHTHAHTGRGHFPLAVFTCLSTKTVSVTSNKSSKNDRLIVRVELDIETQWGEIHCFFKVKRF